METKEPSSRASTPVLHDNEQPLLKKPSFLFLLSTSIGVFLIVLLAVNAYYGLIRF